MLFLLPMMVVLAVVAVFPVVYSFWTSLFDLKLTRPNRVPFVGFGNYTKIFQDALFWESAARTAWFTVMSVSAIMVIATLMWKWIYDSGYGALNGLLYQLDFIDRYMVWLGDADKTLALIANAFVWKEAPLATILLLVTMKSIPSDLYSAAKVDGANVWRRFLHVTLPSLRPGFMLVIVYETMMAVRHFDLLFILTEGGPAEASHVLAWQVYVETFRKLSFGTGSALAYVMALVTFVLAWSVIRTVGRKL